jgi:hypothetical protein
MHIKHICLKKDVNTYITLFQINTNYGMQNFHFLIVFFKTSS